MKLQNALEEAMEDSSTMPNLGEAHQCDGVDSPFSTVRPNGAINEIDSVLMVEACRLPENESTPPAYDQAIKVTLNPDTLTKNRCLCYFPGNDFTEHYKVLRTQIQQLAQAKDWRTIMVTSAMPGEGKTLTAINLALTFAKAYSQTVLLVDADLRKQDICARLGFESEVGVGDYLVNDVPFANIVVWPGVEKMTVISGARPCQKVQSSLVRPR